MNRRFLIIGGVVVFILLVTGIILFTAVNKPKLSTFTNSQIEISYPEDFEVQVEKSRITISKPDNAETESISIFSRTGKKTADFIDSTKESAKIDLTTGETNENIIVTETSIDGKTALAVSDSASETGVVEYYIFDADRTWFITSRYSSDSELEKAMPAIIKSFVVKD